VEKPVCELCGKERIAPLFKKDGFQIVKCRDCSFCFVYPQENHQNIAERYDSESYFNTEFVQKFGYGNYIHDHYLAELWFKQLLERIYRFSPPPGLLLDVGCALGYFLAQAHTSGWEVQGLERSQFAVQYAQNQFQLNIHHGTLENNQLQEHEYDIVTMFDVLEHVLDINIALKEITRLVKQGGLLVLTTPNEGGLSRKIMRKYWFHFKPYEHTYYFSEHSLRQFLEKYGFEVIFIERCYKILNVDVMINRFFHYNSFIARNMQKLSGKQRWKYIPFSFPTGELNVFARKL
jgi:2-polyprenyl-3-methyl-5-hydroxy-6-metoxy-1,4-benzoquinol methylase